MNLSNKILSFFQELRFSVPLPEGIAVMHPFLDKATMQTCRQFYDKYYNDAGIRRMIIGINPGRFGGGVTGIPFTDPVRLQEDCGIRNNWPAKQELSSVFIYDVIRLLGGPLAFYKRFYISAVSPLGFTKNNKNLNYYDDRSLQESLRDFVVECMESQLQFGIDRQVAFCLGEGKNYNYIKKLNAELRFFATIIPLPHPRFIMQYRLKRKDEYLDLYATQLNTP